MYSISQDEMQRRNLVSSWRRLVLKLPCRYVLRSNPDPKKMPGWFLRQWKHLRFSTSFYLCKFINHGGYGFNRRKIILGITGQLDLKPSPPRLQTDHKW
jgi:hypothetical protein